MGSYYSHDPSSMILSLSSGCFDTVSSEKGGGRGGRGDGMGGKGVVQFVHCLNSTRRRVFSFSSRSLSLNLSSVTVSSERGGWRGAGGFCFSFASSFNFSLQLHSF